MLLTLDEIVSMRPETIDRICTQEADARVKELRMQAENVQLKDMVRRLDWKLHAERR